MAGGKGKGSSSNKRSGPSSKGQQDFKRIKAKVGKKAPKKANETDTEFRAARLHVADQVVSRDDSAAIATTDASSLVSSRGRTLTELSMQLGHPAAAARASAVRGIGSIATGLNDATLRAHISTILSAACKCCVDEDDQVRTEGLALLQKMLHKLDNASIKPFCSLLVAYATSALNSLDRLTRVDGAKMVHLLCSAARGLMRSHVHKLFPPYPGILSDRRATKHLETTMESLCSLLKASEKAFGDSTASSGRHQDAMQLNSEPDLVFTRGGRNALIVSRPQRSRLAFHASRGSNWIDLQSVINDAEKRDHRQGDKHSATDVAQNVSMKIVHELLTTLRNVLVEMTEQEDGNGAVVPGAVATAKAAGSASSSSSSATSGAAGASTLSNRKPDVNRLLIVTRCIRLCWQLCPETEAAAFSDDAPDGTDGASASPKAHHHNAVRAGHHIATILLGMFPLSVDDVTIGNDLAQLSSLNALIGNTIMGFAIHEAVRSNRSYELGWVDPLFTFVLPKLDMLTVTNDSSAVLSVVNGILLQDVGDDKVMMGTRIMLIETIYKSIFLAGPNRDADNMRHSSSRKLVMTLYEMVKRNGYLVHAGEGRTDKLVSLLRRMVLELPAFLEAWGDQFQFETMAVVSLLHQVARRIEDRNSPVLASLREQLCCFVTCGTKSNAVAITVSSTSSSLKVNRSIFELVSERIQRAFIGLVVMIESPKQQMITALANICSRSHAGAPSPTAGSAVVAYIYDGLHSICRTMTMQSYLQFLIDGTGMTRLLKRKTATASSGDNSNSSSNTKDDIQATKVDADVVTSLDRALQLTANACMRCGSEKILSMLAPLLSQWMWSKKGSAQDCCLRSRCALALIAVLATDLGSMHADTRGALPTPVSSELPTTASLASPAPSAAGPTTMLAKVKLHQPVIASIHRLFAHLSRTPINSSAWCSPVVVLFILEPSLIGEVVDLIAVDENDQGGSDKSGAGTATSSTLDESVLQVLQSLILDRRMQRLVEDHGQLLLAAITRLRKRMVETDKSIPTVDKVEQLIHVKVVAVDGK